MTFIKSGILLASAASLLALSACKPAKDAPVAAPAAASAAEVSKSPTVATVNDTPITQHTIDLIIQQGAAAGRADTPETRAAIIDQLALQMAVADEAVKKGLDKSPDVTEQLATIRQSVLAGAYVQDYVKNNPVTDEMLKAEYDRIKGSVSGTEYKARHILVENEAQAKDIIAKLNKDPAAFGKLAMEKSKDPGSKVKGGDLGWFDVKGMVPEFGDAVVKLEKGKFTEVPVKTQFGYHVILLEDSRPIEPPPLEAVKDQLSQQVQQQNVKKQIDALKAAAKIVVVAAPAAAASAAPAAPAASAASAAK